LTGSQTASSRPSQPSSLPSPSATDLDYLTVDDLQAGLKISRAAAYRLAAIPDCPVLRLGRTVRFPRRPFLAWLAQHTQGNRVSAHRSAEMASLSANPSSHQTRVCDDLSRNGVGTTL
jgi:hypothetical protein